MNDTSDDMIEDRENQHYFAMLNFAMGSDLIQPPERLLDGTIDDSNILDTTMYLRYCGERTITVIQQDAELRVARGKAGALSIVPCLVSAMTDCFWVDESLRNTSDVAVSLSLKIARTFLAEQRDFALGRQMQAVERAALLILERSKDVASALLAVENPELDKLIDRLSLLDACLNLDDIGISEEGSIRAKNAQEEFRRAFGRLKCAPKHHQPSGNVVPVSETISIDEEKQLILRGYTPLSCDVVGKICGRSSSWAYDQSRIGSMVARQLAGRRAIYWNKDWLEGQKTQADLRDRTGKKSI